jgi:translocator protein
LLANGYDTWSIVRNHKNNISKNMHFALVNEFEFLFVYSYPLAFLSLVVGSIATMLVDSRRLYESSTRPWWAPAAWLFPIVWTILYGLMGAAFWQVRVGSPARTINDQYVMTALILYVIELAVLAAWPWAFFYFGWLITSLFLAVISTCLAAAVIVFFFFIGTLPGALYAAVGAWALFAAVLNLYITMYNQVECRSGKCTDQYGQTMLVEYLIMQPKDVGERREHFGRDPRKMRARRDVDMVDGVAVIEHGKDKDYEKVDISEDDDYEDDEEADDKVSI